MVGLMGTGMVAEMPYLWHTIPILAVSWLLMGIEVSSCGSCQTSQSTSCIIISSAVGKSYFVQLTVF
jgi:hypothetical protein